MIKEMKKVDICCIGHLTKDLIITPGNEVKMTGGTAYYFGVALSHLPKAVSFNIVTKMAEEDAAPVEAMRQEGIDITCFPSRHTVCFENIYGADFNNRRQRVPAKADPFTIDELQDIDARIYHLGSLLQDDFSPELIEALSQKGRISIDVQGFLREVRDENVYPVDWKAKKAILAHTWYLKVNEEEMQTITGIADPHAAARQLHEWGVKEVVITLGDRGSLAFVDGKYYDIPAFPAKELVDATGCGDTYSAGYLYGRVQGWDPLESGRYAARMCTEKLSHHGPFKGFTE